MVKALWRGLKARARKSQSAAMGWLPRTAAASAAQHRSLEAGRPEDGAHSRRPLPAPPLAAVGITAGAWPYSWVSVTGGRRSRQVRASGASKGFRAHPGDPSSPIPPG